MLAGPDWQPRPWQRKPETQGAGRGGQTGLPLSNTTRHSPDESRRQIELNRPMTFPEGSRTGPVLSASVPDSMTSTRSGSHENGASGPS
jgi:hypothetical protein